MSSNKNKDKRVLFKLLGCLKLSVWMLTVGNVHLVLCQYLTSAKIKCKFKLLKEKNIVIKIDK